MNKSLILTALGLAATGASAQEVGQVISSVPVVQQVAVPRQVCDQAAPMAQPQTSGGGGIAGALIGGAFGNALGQGSRNRDIATIAGVVGGAILGNQVEAQNGRGAAGVPQCTTQMSYENRTVGYQVTYEYRGQQHTVQMPNDPGRTVRLQVSPIGAVPSGDANTAGVVTAPPMYGSTLQAASGAPMPPQVVVPYETVYPAYYPVYRPAYYPVYNAYPYYYPPVGVSLNLGYARGWGGYRHYHR